MRLTDSAGKTDPGRKRRRNEDTFVLEPPLFAVADGMGGAQAGEVASRIAAAAFREFHDADQLAPAGACRPSSRRRTGASTSGPRPIPAPREWARRSPRRSLKGGQVAIGHVGDSRAYRIATGRLEQLTDDHSLVADLMRTGRLTPEEAEAHPQRSVITRALGTDSEVDVDTRTVEPSPVTSSCSAPTG